jgi:hypothetical protein
LGCCTARPKKIPRRWSGARLALWGNMMSAQLTLHDDDANPCVSHRQSRAPKQHPRKLLEDRGTSGVNRATIYRARSGSVLLVGLQVRSVRAQPETSPAGRLGSAVAPLPALGALRAYPTRTPAHVVAYPRRTNRPNQGAEQCSGRDRQAGWAWRPRSYKIG